MTMEFPISFSLDNLIRFINQELKLFGKVEHKVKLLRDRLERLHPFHQSPQRRSLAAVFIKQIRDAINEAEYVIDIYIIDVHRLSKWYKFLEHRRRLGNVSGEITKLNEKFDTIFEDMAQYERVNPNANANVATTTTPSGTVVDEVNGEDVVGFEKDLETLMNQLTRGGEMQVRVISIIGMGGSGKTTLAKKLYEDDRIKNHFDYRAWVNLEGGITTDLLPQIIRDLELPEQLGEKFCQIIRLLEVKQNRYQQLKVKFSQQSYQPVLSELVNRELHKQVKDLLQKIPKMTLKEMRDSASELFQSIQEAKIIDGFRAVDQWNDVLKKQEYPKEMLSARLRRKRYLIVMDDVRETQVWENLKSNFPDDTNGSRILITSRDEGVRPNADSPIHFIRKLNEEDSWRLVDKMVFGDSARPTPNFKLEAKKIAMSCDGLPLGLVVLGRFLEDRLKSPRRSELKQNSFFSYGREQWRGKLAPSYAHLKPDLKRCLFYSGVFPASYEIPVRQLIQFWIAEDFIPQDDSMETIAEQYLQQLIDICLIQPTSFRLDGGVKTCRIHNILRDLWISENMKEDILEVPTDVNCNSQIHSSPRRLSVHCNPATFVDCFLSPDKRNTDYVRSFLSFGKETCPMNEAHWKKLRQGIPVIRVLNLGNVQFQSFPKGIDKLTLLKYLKLKVKGDPDALKVVLPDSICDLRYLVTLDLRGSAVNCLPVRIWKLQNLRHIFSTEPTKLPRPPKNSKSLPSLQVFSRLALDHNTVDLITTSKLPSVRKLGLFGNSKITKRTKQPVQQDMILRKVFEKMNCLPRLERLKIKIPSPDHIVSPPSLFDLKSLTKISLVESNVSSSDFEVLGRLPELKYLKVVKGSSNGNALTCASNSFAQLESFKMTQFSIQIWTLSVGAMPRLRNLIIKDCKDLRKISEVGHLAELKEVHVHRPCSLELERMLQEMQIMEEYKILFYDPPPHADDKGN